VFRTALLGYYCAAKQNLKSTSAKDLVATSTRSPKFHLTPGNHLDAGYNPELNHLLFRLDRSHKVVKAELRATDKGISIEELERCIPWIPQDTRVFICCPDRFQASLLKRLSSIETSRDLYLLSTMSTVISQRNPRSKQI
jgi:hypothetical protein